MHASDCVVRRIDDDWDDALVLFADASMMQTRSYAAARWPTCSLEQVCIERQGRIIGAAQVIIRKLPFLGGGLAYLHFGPLWRRNGTGAEPVNFDAIVHSLIDEYVDNRTMLLRIRPAIFPPDSGYAVPRLESRGFVRHQDKSPDRFIVDLSLSLEQIEKGFTGKWRYNLRRSQKNGLDVTDVDGDEGIDQFLCLYREMLARKSFVDTSAIDEFAAIQATLPPALKPRIFLCRRANEPVAAAIVSHIGDSALYLFGASSAGGTKACAGYLLQWAVMRWLKERSCRWYDLGGDSGSAGLRQFKSGIVGRTGRIVPLPGDFEKYGSGLSPAAVRAALSGRAVLQSFRTVITRRGSA